MSEKHFTEEEKGLLVKYQELGTPSLSGRLAFEIIPPVIFVGAWFFTGHALYLLALIIVLVGYNVFRVVRQHKNLSKLNSISKKTIGEVTSKKVPASHDHAA